MGQQAVVVVGVCVFWHMALSSLLKMGPTFSMVCLRESKGTPKSNFEVPRF